MSSNLFKMTEKYHNLEISQNRTYDHTNVVTDEMNNDVLLQTCFHIKNLCEYEQNLSKCNILTYSFVNSILL